MARRKSKKEWLDRIDTALKITQDYRKNYKTYVNYYRGKQWALGRELDAQAVTDSLDAIVVNWVYNTIRTIVPTVFFKNPRIFVQATKDEYRDRVPILNAIANYDWRRLKIKREMKRTILRSLIGGIAYLETGYSFLEETVETEYKLSNNTSPVNIITGQSQNTNQDIKFTEMRIRKDSPYVFSRSLLEIAVDPFANELEERAWHAIKEVAPLEFVKKDPRFSGTGKLQANVKIDEVQINKIRKEYGESSDAELIELWHITDRWKGRTFTIARGHNGLLREFDTPIGYDLVPLFFNEDPEGTQHISVVSIIKDQQDEINRLRAYMLEHVKRTLPRLAYDRTIITDEEDVNAITDSDMDQMIGVPGNPDQLIKPINFSSLSPDLYATDNRMKEDMQIGSGLSGFQRGQAEKVPSATEAQLIEQSSRLRVNEGLDTVSDTAEELTKNIVQLRQRFTTGNNVIPIIGENNQPLWDRLTKYNREQIQGDYEYYAEYGSTQQKDQDFLKNQWLQLTPQIANLAAQPSPANITLGRELLKVFEVSTDIIDRIFPMQQKAPIEASVAPPTVGAEDIFNLLRS